MKNVLLVNASLTILFLGMFQRCWSAILSGCMRARATPNPIE